MAYTDEAKTSLNRLLRRAAVYGITLLILVLSIWCIAAPKQSFSENENRALASWPVFTMRSLQDGSYMSGIQSYLSDHFPLRDQFMTWKTRFEMLSGKKEINGIYLADDGYYIEEYDTPTQTEKVITQLQKLSDNISTDAALRLMLVPTAVSSYNDKLPSGAPDRGTLRQVDTMNEIYAALPDYTKADAWTALQAAAAAESANASGGTSSPELYYRTDHHWTTHGAYIGYQAYCASAGIAPLSEDSFQKTVVSEDFHGTIYSKLHDSTVPGDAITIYERPENRLTVSYPDTGETTDTLYNFSYLEQKDKYSMFLNNLHPLVEISNAAADSDRQLVLIKDSYANSMVPFLVNHYQKIYVLDTRYYRFGPSSFVNEHPEVTDVAVLYNMNTIDTDLGIGGIF